MVTHEEIVVQMEEKLPSLETMQNMSGDELYSLHSKLMIMYIHNIPFNLHGRCIETPIGNILQLAAQKDHPSVSKFFDTPCLIISLIITN